MAFSYYKRIGIAKSTAGDLTNYVEMITVDTATLITASKLQADCDDLQFFADDGVTQLKHWIMPETKNTATTRCFVKIPTVTGSATTYIRMYYGDAAATNTEDGLNTFPLFDDFSGEALHAAINSSKWPTLNGTWTEEDDAGATNGRKAYCAASGYASFMNAVPQAKPVRTIRRWKISSLGTANDRSSQLLSSSPEYIYATAKNDRGNKRAQVWRTGGTQIGSTNFSWADDTWYTHMCIYGSDNKMLFYYDYLTSPASLVTSSAYNAGTTFLLAQEGSGICNHSVDYIAMMSYDAGVSNVGAAGIEIKTGVPQITEITVSYLAPGESGSVTITGTDFNAAATVKFTKTGEADIDATNVVVTGTTQIDCDIAIPGGTTPGWWDCVVTNP